MQDIQSIIEQSAKNHDHLCPRQVLGVRAGVAGLGALNLPPNTDHEHKRVMVILETDGCFADGVSAATGCTVGHRTLRIEDSGKVGVTFADTKTGAAVRVAPKDGVREKAAEYAPEETKHYFAQLKGYQIMPEEELFKFQRVQLITPVEKIVSRHGPRKRCAVCGEEIINEREVEQDGKVLCRNCAGCGYYEEIDASQAEAA